MPSSIRNAATRRAGHRRQTAPQRRPVGPYFPVDGAWKAHIRGCLEQRSMSQAELARRIGASPGSIVLIFKPETIQSRLVPAIHKVLELDPPATTLAREAA